VRATAARVREPYAGGLAFAAKTPPESPNSQLVSDLNDQDHMTSRIVHAVRVIVTSTVVASPGLAQTYPASPPLSPPGERMPEAAPAPLPEPAPDRPADDATLFKGKIAHGGFGAAAVKITPVDGEAAVMPGVQGGWIIGHSLVIGLAGFGLATRQEAPAGMRVQGRPSTLEMGYGGFRAGYILLPKSIVHLGFGVLVGAGGVAALSRDELLVIDDGQANYERRVDNSDAFFVTEPEIEAEINVTKFMRVAVSGSYRFVADIDSPGLSASRVGGPAAGLALRFGAF
jgi:hypothetical protein